METELRTKIVNYLDLCSKNDNLSLLTNVFEEHLNSQEASKAFTAGLIFGRCLEMITNHHSQDTIPVQDIEELRKMITEFMNSRA